MDDESGIALQSFVFQVASLRNGSKAAQDRLSQTLLAKDVWRLCAEALSTQRSFDGDVDSFVRVFCASRLANLARRLPAWCPKDELQCFREAMRLLLCQHPGKTAVLTPMWRQIGVALVASELWLGCWKPLALAGTVPAECLKELLLLPVEMLYCDQALPLGDVQLWQLAAGTLVKACEAVFSVIFRNCVNDPNMLEVLPGWLKAARLSFEWLDMDEARPLRALHEHLASLLSSVEAMPDRGCEIAQQLARWVRCDAELKPILRPILDRLLPTAKMNPTCPQLVPLLADLAADRWPRACLNDPEVVGMLDVLSTADAALLLLRNTGEDGDASDAEAALAVWQSLAGTALCGTVEWEDEAELGAGRHSEWWVPRQQVLSCPVFPELFARLVPELLRMLQCPSICEHPKLEAVMQVRAAAETTISAWAALMGESAVWAEATWEPLKSMTQRLATQGQSESLAKEAEVTLWFSYTLAASWRERTPAAAAVLDVGDRLDSFPAPWRSLLWMQASCLASTGPSELSTRLLEWMLQRPPQLAGAPVLLSMTELPYASSLEMACRQLPATAAFGTAAERLLRLALIEVPVNQLHPQSVEAKARLLRAMAHVMGGDAAQLCGALRQQILPSLCTAAQVQENLFFMRMVIAILHAVLPRTHGDAQPAISLWRDYWDVMENALLHQPCCIESDGREQPLDAAAEAIQLLAMGAARRRKSGSEICLAALESVMQHLPSPPLEPALTARAVSAAVGQATEAVLSQPDSLQNPAVLKALFALWSRGLAAGKAAAGLLRPNLLANCTTVDQLLGVFCSAMPAHAEERMVRWLNLLLPRDGREEPSTACSILQALPSIYAAMFQALAVQDSLTRWDGGVMDVAEFMYFSAEMFPSGYPAAVAAGLRAVPQLPPWNQQQVLQLLNGRQEWPRRSAWICSFQQLIQDWQRDRLPDF
eukprot:s4489_g8.t1